MSRNHTVLSTRRLIGKEWMWVFGTILTRDDEEDGQGGCWQCLHDLQMDKLNSNTRCFNIFPNAAEIVFILNMKSKRGFASKF